MTFMNGNLRISSFLPASFSAARRLLALLLIVTVSPVAPLLAQATVPQSLHITILDGEDAINNIRERTAREPIVQVEDENHKPVAGALLLFTIQGGPNGAGATFNGLNTLTITTDAEGKGIAHGLKPNETQGSYSIAVSATLGMIVATAIIKQTNGLGGGAGGAGTPTTPVSPTSAAPTSVAPSSAAPTSSSTAPGTTAPATTAPGTSSSTSVPATTSTETAAPSTGSSITTSGIRHTSRLPGLLRSPWLFSAIGVVVVTVAVRTVVVAGHNPTSISAGTGTVGPP